MATFFRDGKVHQEYGPAVFSPDHIWVYREKVTRINGPSIILGHAMRLQRDPFFWMWNPLIVI